MHFEKVSFDRFVTDIHELYGENTLLEKDIRIMYDTIQIPKRSTVGSAGYDFVIPYSLYVFKNSSIVIPTGIRAVNMPENVVLLIAPRSGLGFKYRVSLANTIGVIDSDYAGSSNEGHILIKICYDDFNSTSKINDSYLITNNDKDPTLQVITSKSIINSDDNTSIFIQAGDRFCQGIFTFCLFTSDDDKSLCKTRDGGFGSTSNM